jgi:hypothetical protein
MTFRKLGLAACLALGVAGSTLIVHPALAQVPNPVPEGKSSEVVVFALKHADASKVARMLSQLYNENERTPTGGPRRIPTLSVTVDDRANSVVIFAPSARLDEIKALVAKLDQDVPPNTAGQPTLRVFPLRFAEPDKALESALQLAMTGNGQFTLDRVRKQIIISTNDDAVLKQVQELLIRLDQAPAERAGADVQVRIVWLVQGRAEEFSAPPDDIKDVLPALAKLGIEKPRLAAQIIVNSTPNSQFRADGTVKLGETAHLSVMGQFLERSDPASLHISIKASGNGGEICNLSTEISAPMGHLVVLGVTPTKDMTSVFVVQVLRKESIKPSR